MHSWTTRRYAVDLEDRNDSGDYLCRGRMLLCTYTRDVRWKHGLTSKLSHSGMQYKTFTIALDELT